MSRAPPLDAPHGPEFGSPGDGDRSTDEDKITARLRAREAELARVQRIGRIGGFEVDLSTSEYWARRSPEYRSLYALPEDVEAETHTAWLARLHPDDREAADARLRRALASDCPRYENEYRIVRSGGEIRWIAAIGEIERNEAGHPTRLIGVHQDITERKEAEAKSLEIAAELLSTEERLRLATEAADIGWWDVEEGHGRLSWPARVKAMFGISPNAPVSMDDFYNGLHPDDRDRVTAAYAGAADPARRELYDVEFRTLGKADGIVRWVAAKGRGVFDETGRCTRMIGTAIDITDRKLAQEEKLAREKEDAELREQFIAVLGHDLRNPLASVAAGTRFLARHPEKAGEIAAQIEQSISRMSELIENVLDFARGRLGGGFITTRDSEEPLEPSLLQVIEELRSVSPERNLAVDIDLREPVECDRQRIGQLLSNLLGNAFVYGAPNAPIQVHARADGGQLKLSVTNFGEVIEPSALERLFQPFFRGGVRDKREGVGLGLYICSEIAKAHGGTIDVTSESGTTSFTLRIPTRA
jgi:PAS domain S-box-containing protein